MSTSDQLQQAYRLIRDGNKTQAMAIIVPIVRAEPNNADAWWLLANAVSEVDQQRRALEQVLRLRPNDDKARQMMERIGGFTASPPVQQSPDPWATQSPPPSDPFAHVGSGQPAPYYAQPGAMQSAPPIAPQRKGTNPCVIVLAIIGFVVVIGCAACMLLSGGTIGTLVSGVLGTLTADPDLANTIGTLVNLTPEANNLGSQLSGNFTDRGTIERGQTLNASVDSLVDDGWTFDGTSGDSVTIEVRARDSALDPQLYLYDPQRLMIAENDDINLLQGNTNSRISITLPVSGKYTIIVSAFGNGGDYEISVR